MRTAKIVLISVGCTLLVVFVVLVLAIRRDRLSPLPERFIEISGTNAIKSASEGIGTPDTSLGVHRSGNYPASWTTAVANPPPIATNGPSTNAVESKTQPPPPPVQTAALGSQASQPSNPNSTSGATIAGTVIFDGPAPKRKIIATDADPRCAAMHADNPLLSEEVIVNANGTLKNAFVYILSGLDGLTFDVPRTPATINQIGCRYEPHVFGMMARQRLLIVNNDPTLHNIHALPTRNPEFNIGQPNQGMQSARSFANPEVMVHFKCDVHPWMSAYVGVLDHPFFSVSDDNGVFLISGLPPGDYQVATWHEKYGVLTQTVTVAENESKSITFTYAP